MTGSARRVLLAFELIFPETGCDEAIGSSGSIVCRRGVATLMVVRGIEGYLTGSVSCWHSVKRHTQQRQIDTPVLDSHPPSHLIFSPGFALMTDMASASDQAELPPDEFTALLAGRSTPSTPPQFGIQPPLAAINPLAKQIQRQGLLTLDEVMSSPSSSSPAEKTAYKLLVCLRLLAMYKTLRSAKSDVYMQWEEDEERHKSIRDLETRIHLTWKEFVEEGRVGDDIHACLWTAFPLEEGEAPRARGMYTTYTRSIDSASESHQQSCYSGGLPCSGRLLTNSVVSFTRVSESFPLVEIRPTRAPGEHSSRPSCTTI